MCKYQGGQRPCPHRAYTGDDRCRRHILRDEGFLRGQRMSGEWWVVPDRFGSPSGLVAFESAWRLFREAQSAR